MYNIYIGIGWLLPAVQSYQYVFTKFNIYLLIRPNYLYFCSYLAINIFLNSFLKLTYDKDRISKRRLFHIFTPVYRQDN